MSPPTTRTPVFKLASAASARHGRPTQRDSRVPWMTRCPSRMLHPPSVDFRRPHHRIARPSESGYSTSCYSIMVMHDRRRLAAIVAASEPAAGSATLARTWLEHTDAACVLSGLGTAGRSPAKGALHPGSEQKWRPAKPPRGSPTAALRSTEQEGMPPTCRLNAGLATCALSRCTTGSTTSSVSPRHTWPLPSSTVTLDQLHEQDLLGGVGLWELDQQGP